MTTLAFVQARMSSARLPGKVLEPLAGTPALERIVARLRRATGLDGVAVLTSTDPHDDPVAELAARIGADVFRGSLTDVLARFASAAAEFGARRVVRVTADCPLVDPELIDRLLALHSAAPAPCYAAIAVGAPGVDHRLRRFPNGLDAETFPTSVLARAHTEATARADREHVTPYIKRALPSRSVLMLEAEEDHGGERWTVDYAEDLAFVRAVYDRLSEPFGYSEVLDLLAREPGLRQINAVHLVPALRRGDR